METLICLTVVSIALIYSEFSKKLNLQSIIALVGLAATLLLGLSKWNTPYSFFNNMGLVDNDAILFNSLIIISTILVVLLSTFYYKNGEKHVGEIFGLMTAAVFGGFLITGYTNLIMLYLGIETLSIPLYVLAGSKKSSFRSNEAAFKYYVMGGVASAILLFGIAFLYGSFGSFYLSDIAQHVASTANLPGIFYTGLIMIIVGFLFKVAAMPFHFWTPDVYDGSPSVITAFMASVVKIAAFVAFYRFMSDVAIPVKSFWMPVIWGVTAITLIASNIIALNIISVKRLLAYASISSSGFLLLAILALGKTEINILYYYLISYSFAIIPAFGVVMAVRKANGGDDSLNAFVGLARRNPFLTGNMVVALLSLAGIPFTAGFFAKFYLFLAAIKGGFIWITIIAVIAAVISIYYFFRVINRMFAHTENETPIASNIALNIALAISSIISLILGILPGLIIK